MSILSLEHGKLIGKKDVWKFHKMVIMLKLLVIFEQIPCFSYVKFICWSTIYGYRIQTQKYWRSKRLILLFLVMTHHWEFKFKFFVIYHLKNIWQISLKREIMSWRNCSYSLGFWTLNYWFLQVESQWRTASMP